MKTAEEKLQRNFERQRMYQQRAIKRRREKQANPEWRQAQYDKQRERQSRYIERAKNKPFKRGLKGRTPRAAERSLINKIGVLPCIACYVHGVINEVVSLHHINGRTITGAHAFVLPLCNHHHHMQRRQQYALFIPGLFLFMLMVIMEAGQHLKLSTALRSIYTIFALK